MRTFTAAFATVCFMHSGMAWAEKATPNNVFQVTEQIVQELQALNAENFSKSRQLTVPKDPTKPRHVLFLIRDQWRKVQLLRYMNGLDTHSLPPETVHAVTPSEVKTQADRLLIEVQELRSAYGLSPSEIKVALPKGKTPTDVYGSLLRISAELDALGVPSTVPNDVYRVAASVVENLEVLAQQADVAVNRDAVPKSKGRTPADAYSAGLDLIEAMNGLAANVERYNVDGGIIAPAAVNGPKSPADVIVVLSRAQADAMALLNTAKAGKEVQSAPYEGGKTPSDVYDSIVYARLLIEALAS
ncbi:hypothetical protein GFB49_12655 [Epibacterium sp. SM1979]|uniref:Uncharacterized protein n=1 Tax=Tritonibacter litoralis TaxID=2662264 RepID=A0A843YD70_9RHOB|nr:hypothetical protein [Tritonibacter litoralis]MQQ09310.1 hypothetical protein [Tritonibacter litoralis]